METKVKRNKFLNWGKKGVGFLRNYLNSFFTKYNVKLGRKRTALVAMLIIGLVFNACTNDTDISLEKTKLEGETVKNAKAIDLKAQMPRLRPAQSGFTWTHNDEFVKKSQGSDFANIHIYGWGTLWPFADGAPNEFDEGQKLQSRIDKALNDGQEVMLTLATAPSGFRTSGEPWEMNEKVAKEHEDKYVARVKAIVKNKPNVKYVQVWNEFKGFWDKDKNRWDYEAYTAFYNKVYKGVKAVRPDIRVGGGYIALRNRNDYYRSKFNGVEVDRRDVDAMRYWMKNAVGFDAICLDGNFKAGRFSKLTTYFKSLPESNKKPVWWSEFYDSKGSMAGAAKDVASNLEDGDKMMWWAESQYLPFVDALIKKTPAQVGSTWTQDDIFVKKSQGSDFANIHIYGWGTLWPFADGAPNEFDKGQKLQSRIDKAVEDGQEVMLTLATAPSRFRASGKPWNMNEKVSKEHEDTYVDRVKAIVKNRPKVKYVQVWNEFKGFWNSEKNRWDYEAYTAFYNKVYRGVKAVRPDIIVGGGYIALRNRIYDGHRGTFNGVEVDKRDVAAMRYWMKNAVGFDAICLDGNFEVGSFSKLTTYFRSLPESKKKPIWWSEFYNQSGTMAEVAKDVASNLKSGDKMMWWSETRFMPFEAPID